MARHLIWFIIVWSLLPLPIAVVVALLWTQMRLMVVDRRSRFKPDYARILEVERDVGICNGGYPDPVIDSYDPPCARSSEAGPRHGQKEQRTGQ